METDLCIFQMSDAPHHFQYPNKQISMLYLMIGIMHRRAGGFWHALGEYHKLLPKAFLIQFIHNIKTYIGIVTVEKEISAACACSGSAIWKVCNDALLKYWAEEFDLVDVPEYKHAFIAEIKDNIAEFCRKQHGIPCNFGDLIVLHFWD